jgi:hypothetical protein
MESMFDRVDVRSHGHFERSITPIWILAGPHKSFYFGAVDECHDLTEAKSHDETDRRVKK